LPVRSSAARPAPPQNPPVPNIQATQPLHPPAGKKQPAVNHKQSAAEANYPPASGKPNQKKEPKKVDLDKVRKEIQGMARDWIMKTAKQGGQQA
jgi:hypothetical protein